MLGLYDAVVAGKPCVVEYEPDTELRDTEQVLLLEEGGIATFIRREVLPYTPDAWVNNDATEIGYEISFTRPDHPHPVQAPGRAGTGHPFIDEPPDWRLALNRGGGQHCQCCGNSMLASRVYAQSEWAPRVQSSNTPRQPC